RPSSSMAHPSAASLRSSTLSRSGGSLATLWLGLRIIKLGFGLRFAGGNVPVAFANPSGDPFQDLGLDVGNPTVLAFAKFNRRRNRLWPGPSPYFSLAWAGGASGKIGRDRAPSARQLRGIFPADLPAVGPAGLALDIK